MADNQERGTFEVEREALRSALRFPAPPSRAERLGFGAQPSDAQIRLQQRAGDPLTAITAAVEHMASSLDSLVERIERLTERLGALEATFNASGKRLDAWPEMRPREARQ